MHMTFWWSTIINDFLFPDYNIKTVTGLISTCFGLSALAILFEWLKLIQARIRQRELILRAQQLRTICPSFENASLLFDTRPDRQETNITWVDKMLLFTWDALVWLNLQILGYLLMLVVMVYNGWMTIALILGSAIGYFLFGPSFIKLNLQNCRVMRDTFCSSTCGESEHDGETTPALEASNSAASISHVKGVTSVCVHTQPEYEEI